MLVASGNVAVSALVATATLFRKTLGTAFDKETWLPVAFTFFTRRFNCGTFFDGLFVSKNQKQQRANNRKGLARMTFLLLIVEFHAWPIKVSKLAIKTRARTQRTLLGGTAKRLMRNN